MTIGGVGLDNDERSTSGGVEISGPTGPATLDSGATIPSTVEDSPGVSQDVVTTLTDEDLSQEGSCELFGSDPIEPFETQGAVDETDVIEQFSTPPCSADADGTRESGLQSIVEPFHPLGFMRLSGTAAQRVDNSPTVGASWDVLSDGYGSASIACSGPISQSNVEVSSGSRDRPPNAACPILGASHIGMTLPTEDLPKFFWETDPFLSQIFTPVKPKVDFSLKRPLEMIEIPDDVADGKDVFSLLKKAGESSRGMSLCAQTMSFVEPKQDDSLRASMVSNWASIVGLAPKAFAVGRAILDSEEFVTHDILKASLDACFGRKATATIAKRFYAINKYVKFCTGSGLQCFPLLERCVFSYMQSLVDSGSTSPSTGRSFVEAVRFTVAVLGLSCDTGMGISARVDGLAANLSKTGRPMEQAGALTVQQVIQLERMVVNSDSLQDKCILGAMLIMLYSCARHSDAQRTHELIVDAELDRIDPDSVEEQGFIELRVLGNKAAKTEALRRKLLPVVAPVFTMAGVDWVRSWLQARDALGLTVGELNLPLLCRFGSEGEPLNQEATSSEISKILRLALGVSPDQKPPIRSHSLKCTALTWVGKWGLDVTHRRLLGHHLDPASKSAETYNRSAMAAPLRSLLLVLADIRTKRFLPDVTRSGRFVDGEPIEGPGPDEHHVEEDEFELTDSGSDDDSASDTEAEVASAGISDETLIWSLVEPGLRPAFIQTQDGFEIYRNNTSGLQHLCKKDGRKFLCGRPVSERYTKFAGNLVVGVPVCETCSNHKDLPPRQAASHLF